jgi:hypothetical protein
MEFERLGANSSGSGHSSQTQPGPPHALTRTGALAEHAGGASIVRRISSAIRTAVVIHSTEPARSARRPSVPTNSGQERPAPLPRRLAGHCIKVPLDYGPGVRKKPMCMEYCAYATARKSPSAPPHTTSGSATCDTFVRNTSIICKQESNKVALRPAH